MKEEKSVASKDFEMMLSSLGSLDLPDFGRLEPEVGDETCGDEK